MEPSRPPVTVRDPSRPLQRGEVLPEQQEPPAPRGDRRWGPVGVAAAVIAALLVVADVRADRRSAELERRLDGVVQVELAAPGSYDGAYRPLSGEGTVELALRLRNAGPRPVTITGAEQGQLRFSGEVLLAARTGTQLLRLTRSVPCPAGGRLPELEPEGRPLVLQVRTPAGRREAVLPDALPIGSLNEGVQAACGYPPLWRAVTVGGEVLGPQGRTVRMRVELTNTSRWQARLTSLFMGRGLVVLSIDGRTDALPMPLPRASRSGPAGRAVEIVVGLDCGAILSSTSLRPPEEVNVVVDDGSGVRIGQVSEVLADPGELLRTHADKICVTG